MSTNKKWKPWWGPAKKSLETAIISIQSQLEETIKKRVEDIMLYVDQWTECLCEELNMRIEGKQLKILTSFDTWTWNLPEDIENTKEDLREEMADTDKDFHEELDLRIHRTQF
jgi:hypothetical protein